MSTRINKLDLEKLCEHLNYIIPCAGFSIGYAYGKPRLMRDSESRNVSPRLPKPQLYDWIHAFLDGYHFRMSQDVS